MTAEKKLKPNQEETFSDESRRANSKRKYWRTLMYKRKKIIHVGLEGFWSGCRDVNVVLLKENKKVVLESD